MEESGPRRWARPAPYIVLVVLVWIIVVSWFSGSSELSYTGQLHELRQVATDLLVLGVLGGVVAMTVLETLRRSFPLRGIFHRAALREAFGVDDRTLRWLIRPSIQSRPEKEPIPPRLLDMPLEQLMAQLYAFVEEGMRSSGHPSRVILASILGDPAKWEPDPRETVVSAVPPDERAEERQANQVRVRRALELFQIETGRRWRRVLQTAVLVLAALFGLLVAAFSEASPGVRLVVTLVSAVLGAYVATVARDLTAWIERLRRP